MTTLSDADIEQYIANGNLVRGGSNAQIGPACYELRMGGVYYDLTEGDRRIDATATGTILIKPGHRVVLITMEELVIPHNFIARVSSKGSLFSIGLTPVSTYADPGFSGNLGIVTQNQSDKFIEIPIGEPIAKVDFSLLSNPSRQPYRGQHGFQTQVWPIKRHLQKTYADLQGDSRVESEVAESYKILPRAVANVLKRVQSKQRIVDWAIFVAVLMNALVLAAVSTNFFDTAISLVINLISSAVVGLMLWLSHRKE
jgi:dCTP deaminase